MQIKIGKRKFLVKTGKYLEDYILQTKLTNPMQKLLNQKMLNFTKD